jgi:hypothetical protein
MPGQRRNRPGIAAFDLLGRERGRIVSEVDEGIGAGRDHLSAGGARAFFAAADPDREVSLKIWLSSMAPCNCIAAFVRLVPTEAQPHTRFS